MIPRVLYDLSLLGFCQDDPARITGMPRVVLEQAGRLQTSPDCSTTFCATEDPADAYRFIRAHPVLKQARVAAWSEGAAATLDPDVLREAHVFHTPHSAVPDAVRHHPEVSVVQTVYDMIPFLLPETMTAEYRNYYADILQRIRRGTGSSRFHSRVKRTSAITRALPPTASTSLLWRRTRIYSGPAPIWNAFGWCGPSTASPKVRIC